MARLKSTVGRKLKKLLIERFPPPATVRVEDDDGIIGVVTSDEFAGVEPLERQNMIDDLIEARLTRDEQHQIQIIVAVTPDEGTGYLAGVD